VGFTARADRSRDWGQLFKRWLVPAIGAVTPVGLIVVNLAAFIMRHLVEFRFSIAVCAFISAIMLNTWAAINIYKRAKQWKPGHVLTREDNQEVMLIAGMAIVIAVAVLTAYFCYQGLADPNNLPNAQTFITGLVAIGIPIALKAMFDRGARRGFQ
jgi:hypothetical protein